MPSNRNLPSNICALRVCWLVTVLAALSVPALADPISINFGTIDFKTSNALSSLAVDGSYTASYSLAGGLTLTVLGTNSDGGEVHFNQTSDDGLGLTTGEADEIEGSETLILTFSQKVYLHDFDLRDFFYENYGGGDYWYNEIGYYQMDGGGWVQVVAPYTNMPSGYSQNPTNGEHNVVVNDYVTQISFTAEGPMVGEDDLGYQQMQGHEMALYQLRVSVPEPGSLLLLGTGILGLAVLRNKRV